MLFRRGVYHFLSVLLFVFLVLTAWSTTATLTFSKPDRLESWLSQSKLYDHFVATAVEQSQKSVQSSPGAAGNSTASDLSLNNTAVQQAVIAAFTPETLQKSVNTFLDSNYAWLEGKTAKPEFNIDFTQAKQALAANLAAYTEKRAATLPRCTNLLQAQQATDPFTATCLPPGVTPAIAAQTVQQQVVSSQDFLANPVVTPDTINQTTGQEKQPAQPYYQKLSNLPAAYRLATHAPAILSALVFLCGLGVVLLAATKRRGFKRLGILLASAGLVVLLLIFISNAVLHHIENKVFTSDNVGQLQQSLVDFAHRAQSALNRVDLWFGVAFVAAGILTYVLARFLRPGGPGQKESPQDEQTPVEPAAPAPKTPTLIQL